MIERIIAAILGVLGAIAGIFMLGKRSGKQQEQKVNLEANTKVIQDAKKESDVVHNMSSDDVFEQLREFTKDD